MQSLNRVSLYAVRKFSVSSAVNTVRPNPVIDSIIRVDHAGELGADRIYAGQMAVLGNTKAGSVIQHMWDQEKVHRATFEKLIVKYRVRPTALTPIWNVAGFVLGAGTALLGEKAAMACTVAVESVIVDHYNEQLRTLLMEPEPDKELMETIKKFRDEEQNHHDSGINHGAEQAPFYSLLTEVIKFGCKQAIAISKGFLSRPKLYDLTFTRTYSVCANSQPKEKWDLYSSVCLERKPVILKPLTELEMRVRKALLEIEDENSYKSDHEIKDENDKKMAEKLKSGVTLSELDLEKSLQQTAHEFEEMSDKEFSAFQSAPLVTEADEKNDVKSLSRKLSQHLLFLVNEKLGDKKTWILPHGIRKDSETLRETAERVLAEKCGNNLTTVFLGNAPCGFYKYKYPKNLRKDSVGAKIFFFKAFYTGGDIETSKSDNLEYRWATRGEVRKLLVNEKYYKKVSMFLIDEDDEDEIMAKKSNKS